MQKIIYIRGERIKKPKRQQGNPEINKNRKSMLLLGMKAHI